MIKPQEHGMTDLAGNNCMRCFVRGFQACDDHKRASVQAVQAEEPAEADPGPVTEIPPYPCSTEEVAGYAVACASYHEGLRHRYCDIAKDQHCCSLGSGLDRLEFEALVMTQVLLRELTMAALSGGWDSVRANPGDGRLSWACGYTYVRSDGIQVLPSHSTKFGVVWYVLHPSYGRINTSVNHLAATCMTWANGEVPIWAGGDREAARERRAEISAGSSA